jgi:Fe2+ transport system protein B
MDKDKELENMIQAIKNLNNTSDTQEMNINHELNQQPQNTSFYQRIFHPTCPEKDNSKVPDHLNVNIKQQIEEYFASVEFSIKLENKVQECLLQSVQNKEYMNKMIKEVIQQWTNYNKTLHEETSKILEKKIAEIIKICSSNIAMSLSRI